MIKADREAQAAKAREGKTNITRVEGTSAAGVMSWAAYQALPESERLAMPDAKRHEIMAADRKARQGR